MTCAETPRRAEGASEMKTAEAAKVLGVDQSERVLRIARRVGIQTAIGSGYRHTFSPGDVLAMMIVAALHPGQGRAPEMTDLFAEGARKAGEALDAGYPPAYLVTRGGTENVVVIETEDPRATDEMVAALLLSASDSGCAVRVVKLRPMVERLAPWLSALVDA